MAHLSRSWHARAIILSVVLGFLPLHGVAHATDLATDPAADSAADSAADPVVWGNIGGDISGKTDNDAAGLEVSLSGDGNTVAVAAPSSDVDARNSGEVRIYGFLKGSWRQLGSDIRGDAAGDFLGSSVSLSHDGRRVAMGAPGNDFGLSTAGQVKILEFNGDEWEQVGADIYGKAINADAGSSVSISDDGRRVAIGAPSIWMNGSRVGYIAVYEERGGNWVQLGHEVYGQIEGSRLGTSVALSGDGVTVAAGAPYDTSGARTMGEVRVLRFVDGTWLPVGDPIYGDSQGDWSGGSVSLSDSGSVVAIGERGNDDRGAFTGQARVFGESHGEWVQIGADIEGDNAFDSLGNSVSLSGDGTVLATGVHGDIVGNGHVRILELNGDQWVPVVANIPGKTAGESFGYSVSLSNDGETVAVGAPDNSEFGTSAGQVRIFGLPRPVTLRLFGQDRYATAVEVSRSTFIAPFVEGEGTVFIATGSGFADALSAAPAAAAERGPLLLTTPRTLPSVVRNELVRLNPSTIVIVGGTGAVSTSVEAALRALPGSPAVERVSGADRYATSRAIAREYFDTAPTVFIATGVTFPDALAAGPAAATRHAPVVLVPGTSATVDSATSALLDDLDPDSLYIAGGAGAVSARLESRLAARPGTEVTRLAGADRYATAAAINAEVFGETERLYIATGLGFADALAGGSAAAYHGAPLYISLQSCLPSSVVSSIKTHNAPSTIVLGGVSVLGAGVEKLSTCVPSR